MISHTRVRAATGCDYLPPVCTTQLNLSITSYSSLHLHPSILPPSLCIPNLELLFTSAAAPHLGLLACYPGSKMMDLFSSDLLTSPPARRWLRQHSGLGMTFSPPPPAPPRFWKDWSRPLNSRSGLAYLPCPCNTQTAEVKRETDLHERQRFRSQGEFMVNPLITVSCSLSSINSLSLPSHWHLHQMCHNLRFCPFLVPELFWDLDVNPFTLTYSRNMALLSTHIFGSSTEKEADFKVKSLFNRYVYK